MRNVPTDKLEVLSILLKEHPESGIRLWWTVVDNEAGGNQVVSMDCDTGQEFSLEQASLAEEAALRARYGKFSPQAWERLQTKGVDDLMRVAISVVRIPNFEQELQAIQEELVALYPDVRFTGEDGLTLRLPDGKTLQQYNQMKSAWASLRDKQIYGPAQQPLVALIEGKGYETITHGGTSLFTAIVPKWLVLELAERPDVLIIIDRELNPPASSLYEARTVQSFKSAFWDAGYEGGDTNGRIRIGVVEQGVTDTFNTCLPNAQIKDIYANTPEGTQIQEHATLVTGVIISSDYNPTSGEGNRGLAPGAQILSAGDNDATGSPVRQVEDMVLDLIDENDPVNGQALVVNYSRASLTLFTPQFRDWFFEQVARDRRKLVIAAAGNTFGSVASGGLGRNYLTVGAFDYDPNFDPNDPNYQPTVDD